VKRYLENNHPKKKAGGVAQGVGPEFKLQYQQKKKKKEYHIHSHLTPCVL
jgi:hypothetical protein